MGNVVTLKNNMSEEQAEKNRERMANNYAEKKSEIDNLIVEIRTNVSQCNPLHILECATKISAQCQLLLFCT
jgi:hypothetical protein